MNEFNLIRTFFSAARSIASRIINLPVKGIGIFLGSVGRQGPRASSYHAAAATTPDARDCPCGDASQSKPAASSSANVIPRRNTQPL